MQNEQDRQSEDYVETVRGLTDGWVSAMGVRFVRATSSEVIAELDVGAAHRQPLGIVHGGVYSGLVETVTSVGAGIHALLAGRMAVGLENHTSFLHAVRDGRLRAVAKPLARGQRTQVWEATITDDQDRVAATGRVRFLVVERGGQLAGEPAELKGADPTKPTP